MRKKLIYCLLLFMTQLSMLQAYSQQNIAATGVVHTASSNEPLRLAKIMAVENKDTISSVLTDSSGRFFFYHLPEGVIDFIVKCSGYKTQVLSDYKIKNGETVSIRANMVEVSRATILQPKIGKAFQKKVTIYGTVIDSITKLPLSNITVSSKEDPKLGTFSDGNGRFVLNVSPGTHLLFSSVEYNNYLYKVPSTADTGLIIILSSAEVTAANDVIVTAFGRKQLKESVTGAVTSINPQQLKIASSNLTNALAGQAAGIIAYQPGGQPGYDNSQFFIRGVTTFGYNANPLILIDNIESSTTDLARLQVDDIESFSILKDAGSTSLYGSRGANGVLLITTKKGKMEKANVNFNFDNFISSPTKNIKIADPITYMKDYNEGQVTRDPRVIPQFDANKIYNTQQTLNHAAGSNPYVYPAVDWLGSLFKKYTSNRRANLSVRGGGKVAVYYISGSYNLNNGILKVSPVNNFNNNVRLQSSQLRSNIDVNLTKTTVLSLKIGGVFDDYNGPITSDPSGATDLYDRIMHTSPVLFPAYFQPDSANKFTHHVLFGNYSLGGNTNISFDNPYADLLKGYSQYTQSTINAQVDLNQKLDFIVSGLSFSGIFSLNRYSYYSASRQYNPFYYQVQNYNQVSNIYNLQLINNQTTGDIPTEYLDYSPGSKNVSSQAYIQGILNYNQTFGKHTLDVTYVASREQTINSQLNLQDNSALAASLPYRNINSSGKISYTYDRRYSLEGNFGYNGSERFNSNHRWGFFPSVGLAWNVSNESFWKDDLKNVISRFKIRGTYGITGNDALSAQRFFYLSNLTLDAGSPVSFGTANGYTHGGIQTLGYPNPDITWETSRQTNIGVDVTFFRSLSVSVDIYKQYRYNIYQTRVVPQALGLEAPVAANLGSANSKGLDIQIDYSKQISNDLSISGRANLTATQSRYGKYEEPDYPGEPWRKKAGTLINQTYGFVAERLFADNQEAANSPLQSFGGALPMGGDIKYRDINGDGVITQGDDEVPIGDPTVPQITYGFGASLRYKSFDINVFFQGNSKVSFFLDPTQISPYINGGENGSSGATQLLKSFADNHWSQNNQNLYAEYPRLGVTSDAIKNNLQSSTWWLRNGSFLRLKSLQFGYTIASNRLKKYHLNNCRFYADGLNMLLFSSFKEWDVEQGGNAFNYPIQRSFDIGVNININ